MSIFASDTRTTFPIPFDSPHTVTLQKLSGGEIERAQFEHMEGLVTGRARNWATKFIQFARAGTATAKDARKVLTDPLSGYDRLTLAKSGVKAWSYVVDGKPKPVTPEAIDDLDDEALEFFATEILRLTKPGLFQTQEEAEAAQKNG